MDILMLILIVLALLSVITAGMMHRAYSRSQDRVQELTAKVSGLEVNLKDRDSQLNSATQERDELRDNANQLTAKVSGLEANLDDRESQLNSVTQERDRLRDNANKLTQQVASLEANLKAKEKQLAELNAFEERSLNAFKVLSSEIVTDQGELLRSRAVESVNNLIEPLSEKIGVLDRARAQAEGSLSGEITRLTSETGRLASALTRAPHVRGRWGEMQVERALELAGLTRDTHYTAQATDGTSGRPDFIVHLSNDRDIIIDSKVSLVHYLDAEGATNEEERNQFLEDHARAVRSQVNVLAGRSINKPYQIRQILW